MTVATLEEQERDRFWRNVHVGATNECWPWLRWRDRQGYGKTKFFDKTVIAHRLAYSFVKGPIPAGLLIRHVCDFPPCCNPHLLVTGTNSDNRADAIARGRILPTRPPRPKQSRSACSKGHSFDDANTRLASVGMKQVRICRSCERERLERLERRRVKRLARSALPSSAV
jgi:hypothetical protein